MRFVIPDFLIEAIGDKDITIDFTKYLISKAEEDIRKEQQKIAELQKIYKAADVKGFAKKYVKSKKHTFRVDEDLMSWDSAETIMINRYREIDKLRRFLSAYRKKHPSVVKRER